MPNLRLIGKQLVDKAQRKNYAAKYDVVGDMLYMTLWLSGGETEVINYDTIVPSIMSDSTYEDHIRDYVWTQMKAVWEKQLTNVKSNKTILLCLNTLDC